MIGLAQQMTVYTPNETTGAYDQTDGEARPCRLALVGGISGAAEAANPERADLSGRRRLLWGPGYTMPEEAQVAVDGARWNVQAGTLVVARGIGGAVAYQRCEVTRADA
jgi:hypothetical protein